MRKHPVLSLALSLALLTALSAGAQASSSSSKHSSTTSSTTSSGTNTGGKSAAKYHRTHGDITATDASASTFTIKHGKESWTFKTDGSTKFKGLGVKTITLADLQVGDNVRVSYTGSGDDKTAARVDVLHGKKTPG